MVETGYCSKQPAGSFFKAAEREKEMGKQCVGGAKSPTLSSFESPRCEKWLVDLSPGKQSHKVQFSTLAANNNS